MTEEQIIESNKLYLSGEYTLNDLVRKYNKTIGTIRYGWKKLSLPTKLTKEAKSKLMSKSTNKINKEKANQKRKETNLKRYGVENVSALKDVSDKKRKALSTHWGEIKENRIKSLQGKYGVSNIMQVEEVKNKQKQSLYNKYGTTYAQQCKLSNPEIVSSKENLIKWAIDFKNKYSRKPRRKDLTDAVGWIGDGDTSAGNNIHKYGLEDYFMWRTTDLETTFENIIKEWGVKYEHNNRQIIAPLEIDFWFPEQKIGVEINDVASHNSDLPFIEGGRPKAINYHQEKTKKAIDMGIYLIHLYEWELYDDKIIDFLKKLLLKERGSLYARNCIIKDITKKVADDFIEKYHLQGKCSGNTINIGLFDNDELISVMTFGKPRHSKDYDWELLRYCSSKNIIGGASKLFKAFLDRIDKDSKILSFQDTDKFSGNLYEKLGFEYIEHTKPSYVWVKRDDIFDRYSWFVILKKGVDNVLGTNYGKGKSNIELMLNEGYVRVYNSGMRKYIYNY